jgi:hypothetical protein
MFLAFSTYAAESCLNTLQSRVNKEEQILILAVKMNQLHTNSEGKLGSLNDQIAEKETKLNQLQPEKLSQKVLVGLTRGITLEGTINALKADLDELKQQRKELKDEFGKLQIRITALMTSYIESALASEISGLFFEDKQRQFSVVRKEPPRYLKNQKIGFPIFVHEAISGQNFRFMAIVDATNDIPLSARSIKWVALRQAEIIEQSPNYYSELRIEKFFDEQTLEPVANSRLAGYLKHLGINMTHDLVNQLNATIKGRGKNGMFLTRLLGFAQLSRESAIELNRRLFFSYLQLIALHRQTQMDSEPHDFKLIPQAVILHSLTMEPQMQDKLASLNLALVARIMEEKRFPPEEYYPKLLIDKLPIIYDELYLNHTAPETSKAVLNSQMSTHFPSFLNIEESSVALKTPFLLEEKLWKAGMKVLNPHQKH